MFAYTTNTGLDSLKLIIEKLHLRTWWVPDLVCDEVLDEIKNYYSKISIRYYHIKDDLTVDWSTVEPYGPSVLYLIDYFGEEQSHLGYHYPDIITIRDSVFTFYPKCDLRHNEVWFNSLRKLVRGVTGSLILSTVELGGVEASRAQQLCLTYDELSIREDNKHTVSVLMPEFSVEHHPTIPTLYPLRIKNRDEVLSSLDFKLPGMWKNKYKLNNRLYDELTFLPLDSRFSRQELVRRCDKIRELAKPIT